MLLLENASTAIDEVRRLRRYENRLKTGLTIAEGYPEVFRAKKAGILFCKLYICREICNPLPGEFDEDVIIEVSKEVFAQMAFGERLKGILAVVKPAQRTLNELVLSANPLAVILEGVEKPGNLGTIVRTCDGAGADVLINCESRTDIYNHNIVRSSIGTVFHVPSISASNKEALSFLRKNQLRVIVTSAKAKKDYTQASYKGPTAVVAGNEHDGVSSFWVEEADELVSIPMRGQATSLNVSVSASIMMYEVLRQRKTN